MRRRFRRGGFRKKSPSQWVVAPSWGAANAVTAGTQLNLPLVGSTPQVDYDPPAILRYTVQRIRGFLLIQPGGVGPPLNEWAVNSCYAVAGIYLSTVATGGTFQALSVLSPADSGSGNWLWFGSSSTTLMQYTNAAGTGDAVWGAVIPVDVKSKRVCREGQKLLLALNGFSASYTCRPFLRTLISRVA